MTFHDRRAAWCSLSDAGVIVGDDTARVMRRGALRSDQSAPASREER